MVSVMHHGLQQKHDFVNELMMIGFRAKAKKSPVADNTTTLMLRNVPNLYDREKLMGELEELGYKGSLRWRKKAVCFLDQPRKLQKNRLDQFARTTHVQSMLIYVVSFKHVQISFGLLCSAQ